MDVSYEPCLYVATWPCVRVATWLHGSPDSTASVRFGILSKTSHDQHAKSGRFGSRTSMLRLTTAEEVEEASPPPLLERSPGKHKPMLNLRILVCPQLL